MAGYFLLARGWADDEVLMDPAPFSRREAWLWLIEHVAFRPTRVMSNGQKVAVARGQISVSIRSLARSWKWGKGRVELFVRRLETATSIETEIVDGRYLITLCNYEKYQQPNAELTAPLGTENGTMSRQCRDTVATLKKQGKQGKERIKDPHQGVCVGYGTRNGSDGTPDSIPDGIPDGVSYDAAGRSAMLQEAVVAWNAIAARRGLSVVRHLGERRASVLERRLRQCGGLAGWHMALQRMEEVPWLLGENRERWQVSFDFLLKPDNLTKMLEGGYARSAGGGGGKAKPWLDEVIRRHCGTVLDDAE